MRRRAVPALFVLVLGVSAATVAAQRGASQRQQLPRFRAGVELVRVDVVVLDTDGRPVTGLTADDFVLFDRGRATPVSTFTEVAHAPAIESRLPSAPRDVPADVSDNFSVGAARVVALVIDDINLWIERVDAVQRLAHRVIDEMGPDVAMAVIFTSGKGGVEVTQDRALLRRAVDAMDGVHYVFRASGGCGPANFQNCQMLDALTLVAEVLGDEDDPRRKAVIVLSEWQRVDLRGRLKPDSPMGAPEGASIGFPPTDSLCEEAPPLDSYHEVELLQMLRAFRRANVTFYGIDPKGRLETSRERLIESRGNSPIRRCEDPLSISQQVFTETAEATGGFAIVNTNDLDAGIDRIVADLDSYYLLGFYPAEPGDERWHQLQVQVNRPGLTIRHRRGYQLGVEAELPENEDPLVQLSAGILPKTGLPLKLFATPVARMGDDARVAVTAEVRVPSDALRRPGGRLEDRLTLTAIAVDVNRQKVEATTKHVIDVEVPRSRVLPDGDVTYQLVFGMQLRPAPYQLRVSAESARMDAAGSVYLTFVVPNLSDERLAIAGPTIGLAPGSRPPAGITLAEDGLLPVGFDPLLERIFTPADTLRVRYEVWRRDARQEVATRLEIVDDSGAVVIERDGTAMLPEGPASAGPIDLDIPLAAFAPGGYRLVITAGGDGRQARREVGFAVRAAR